MVRRARRTRGVRGGSVTTLPEKVSSTSRVRNAGPREVFHAELTGLEEVPAVLTDATGSFTARVSPDGQSIEYELTFTNLTTPSTEAHLHFAQRGVNGPVFAFLCGGNDKPDCPGVGGTVRGTIRAENILAIPEQGLAAGDLEAAIVIMREGVAYVNVHSTTFPAGEIRGQVRRSLEG